jgi:hypothetical protein
MLPHLARVVNEDLNEAERLEAIRVAVAILTELAPLSYGESLDLDSIRGMTAEWLLGHIQTWRHNDPPASLGDVIARNGVTRAGVEAGNNRRHRVNNSG